MNMRLYEAAENEASLNIDLTGTVLISGAISTMPAMNPDVKQRALVVAIMTRGAEQDPGVRAHAGTFWDSVAVSHCRDMLPEVQIAA